MLDRLVQELRVGPRQPAKQPGPLLPIPPGIHRHRPLRKAPWFLLAGSVAAIATGDVFYGLGRMDVADACYLTMFGLVVLSLLQFTRGGKTELVSDLPVEAA